MIDNPDRPVYQNVKISERFRLVEEPSDVQRKAYKTEQRCLVPTPLVISSLGIKEPKILSGVVSVKLCTLTVFVY